MDSRREFPKAVRVAAFHRAAGSCEGCGARLYVGKYQYDHRIPDGLGGAPTLANCVVLCTACHGEKTCRQDVPAIAKAKRREAVHIGARSKRSRLQSRGFQTHPRPAYRSAAEMARIQGDQP